VSKQAALLALLAGALLAGNSPLAADSIFGARSLGLPVVGADGRSWGMGGVSVAVPGENFSSTNPALAANFTRAGFTGMIVPEYRRPQDSAGSVNLRSYSIPCLALVIPLRKKFVVSGGITQELDMNWRFDREKEFSGEMLEEYLASEGSLYAFSLGAARPLGRQFAIGAGIEFHRGEAVRTWILGASSSETDGSGGLGSADRVSDTYSGESVRFGLLYHAFHWLDVGISLRPGYTLSREEKIEAGTGFEEEKSSRIDMPYTLALGCSLLKGKRLTTGFDLETTPYGDTRFSAPVGLAMQDDTRFSVGIEFTPSRDPLAPFWKKWPLRAGFMWRRLPPVVEGKGISEISSTVGMGIGLGDGVGRMDIFSQLTARGSLDDVGFKERVMRFGISVSGFEKWLPKRKGRPI
jgi:hypothetical protein